MDEIPQGMTRLGPSRQSNSINTINTINTIKHYQHYQLHQSINLINPSIPPSLKLIVIQQVHIRGPHQLTPVPEAQVRSYVYLEGHHAKVFRCAERR